MSISSNLKLLMRAIDLSTSLTVYKIHVTKDAVVFITLPEGSIDAAQQDEVETWLSANGPTPR